jgi:hypothetical protein
LKVTKKNFRQPVPGNDTSWSQEDDSWLKPTLHVEMVSRQAVFFAQSSVLSPGFAERHDVFDDSLTG